MYKLEDFLAAAQKYDASDIHLSVNLQPTWRRFGTLEPIWLQADKLSAADTERLAMGFLNDAQKKLLEERGDVEVRARELLERGPARRIRRPHQHRESPDLARRVRRAPALLKF